MLVVSEIIVRNTVADTERGHSIDFQLSMYNVMYSQVIFSSIRGDLVLDSHLECLHKTRQSEGRSHERTQQNRKEMHNKNCTFSFLLSYPNKIQMFK